MRGSATPRSVSALAALLIGVAGCTICPDPFDYAGPVPNGSAPQNDFRARANGLIPIGSHPVPWPPVVQAAPTPAADTVPVIAATEPEAVDVGHDDGPTVVQPAAAEAPDEAAEPAGVESPRAVAEAPDVTAVPEESFLEAILPPSAPPRPETMPPVRETPGWKPRG